MRTFLLPVLVLLAAAGCDGWAVAGPEAQRLVAQAKQRDRTLVSGALVLVDGVRLTSDKALAELDPITVETVEIVKGAAASRLYGPEGERGVIVITTKRAATPRAPSR